MHTGREAIDDEDRSRSVKLLSPKQDRNPVEVTGKTLIKVKPMVDQINSCERDSEELRMFEDLRGFLTHLGSQKQRLEQ